MIIKNVEQTTRMNKGQMSLGIEYTIRNKRLGNATKPGFHATPFLFLASLHGYYLPSFSAIYIHALLNLSAL